MAVVLFGGGRRNAGVKHDKMKRPRCTVQLESIMRTVRLDLNTQLFRSLFAG